MALGACAPKDRNETRGADVSRAVTKLDCPQSQGNLTRVSAAPDGLSCVYSGEGAEVTLQLADLKGSPAKTLLNPLEQDLRALMPPPSPKQVQATAEKAEKTENAGKGEKAERVNISLPGVSIQADDNGAKIKAAGVNIDANNDGAEIKYYRNIDDENDSGSVKANENGVTVSANDGDKPRHHGRRNRGNVRATFILAGDPGPQGYGVVGYVARGPRGGPLTLAVVKAKGGHKSDGDHDIFNDVEQLVRHNSPN